MTIIPEVSLLEWLYSSHGVLPIDLSDLRHVRNAVRVIKVVIAGLALEVRIVELLI